MTGEIYLTPTGHAKDCDWHVDLYPWECTCGFIARKKAMDDLIAQDADMIDFPLVEAVRELLTDDSVEHLDTFTHNLVQAFNKHGLKVVSTDYLDNLNDTVRGLRQDIKAEQKHTDNALDNMDAAYRRCERLREALVAEREENLWSAYATGDVKGDEWTHMFMSDGEWLAKECGFDPRQGYYSAEAIRNAIPIAARAALEGKQ